MNSKQTDNNEQKKTMPEDWSPVSSVGRKTKPSKLTTEDIEAKFQEMFEDGIVNGDHPNSNATNDSEASISIGETVESDNRNDTVDSLQTKSTEAMRQTVAKRTSSKQRKESFEEYRQTFLSVPKLDDRKPVFISREVRDNLDEIARKLGGRRMSVSGFIENLARHHLETYQDDVEVWKKL